MRAQSKKNESYVLVYSDDHDPSREETAEALDHLKPLPAEEVIPGTIRVVGSRRDVEKCMGELEQWQLSSEKVFRLNPPYKSQLR